MRISGWILAATLMAAPAAAQISNPGFETGFDGWSVGGDASAVALSDEAKSGNHAAKLSAKTGLVKQVVRLEPGRYYELTVQLRGSALIGVKTDGRLYFYRPESKKKWKSATLKFQSGQASSATIFASHNSKTARLDDFVLTDKGPQNDQALSHFVLSKTSGGTGLSPTLPPSENFDLSTWCLSIPYDGNKDGKADSIYEAALSNGYEDDRYFYTGSDGGMVFRAPISGVKTSSNTKYTRTELREMMRAGDTAIPTAKPGLNNWVIGSASNAAKSAAGSVGGTLDATLSVDHVTTTGDANDLGRVIIGQIHGWKNEPIRLYYRLLPGHKRGSLYFAHERQSALAKKYPDDYYDLIGSRSSNADEPADGLTLGEKFSYRIDLTGNDLSVAIIQGGQIRAERALDIGKSGYDIDEEYLYFKAGVYNQNSTGRTDDYVQATFYALEISH